MPPFNTEHAYDFLLMFYCNHGSNSCRFWDIECRKILRPWNPNRRASNDQLDTTKNVNYNEEVIEDVISRPTPRPQTPSCLEAPTDRNTSTTTLRRTAQSLRRTVKEWKTWKYFFTSNFAVITVLRHDVWPQERSCGEAAKSLNTTLLPHAVVKLLKWGDPGAQPSCSHLSPPAIICPPIESIKCYFMPK